MITIAGTIEEIRDKSVLLRIAEGRAEWWPTSQVRILRREGDVVEIAVPDWIAKARKITTNYGDFDALIAAKNEATERKGGDVITDNTSTKGKGRKLVEMRLKNIMRVKAAIIKPEGRVTVLEGDNDQGKSGVVSGFFIPLLGKAALPKEPLRRGAERGWSYLDFGDLKIRRVLTAEGNEYLGVRVAGMEPKRPQEIIDKMLGAAAGRESMFDPMEIVRMGRSPEGRRARMKMLLAMSGYDYDADEAKRLELFADRKTANKSLARLATLVKELPPAEELGEEPKIDEGALKAEIQKEETRDRDIIKADANISGKARLLQEVHETMSRLERELKEAKEREAEIAAEIAKAKEWRGKQVPSRAAELRMKIEAFREEQNAWRARHTHAMEREAVIAEHAQAQEESDRLTKELETIGERRADALAGLKGRIDGLGYDKEHDYITWNGKVIDQEAESDQLLIGVEFIAAILPEDGIRICVFYNWDNLNVEHQARVNELAEKLDLDVLAVRVSKEKHANTLWISDGKCPDDLPDEIEEMDWDEKEKGKGRGKAKADKEPVPAAAVAAPAGDAGEQIEML